MKQSKTKKCRKCKEVKEITDFYERGDGKGVRSTCKKCFNSGVLCNRKKNCTKYKKYFSLYYQRNKDKYKENTEKYRKKNRKRINKYVTERLKNSPQLRVKHSVSALMWSRLKSRSSNKGSKSTFDFLPYTLEELMQRLEDQFTKDMTWKNYGKWHIDHIRPDSSFNYKSTEDKEFQDCWALSNLQPLWATDNLKKGNKII